jgi:hypothetical protein
MAGKKGAKWAPRLVSPTTMEELRRACEAEKIIEALKNHALGQLEMGPSQVTAGIALLKKRLPDLTAIQGVPDSEPIKQVIEVKFK